MSCSFLFAQQKAKTPPPNARTTSAHSSAKGADSSRQQADPDETRLQTLDEAERAAARGGSATAVEEASQKLAAEALSEIAVLDTAERNYDEASKHYRRSLTLQDLPAVRSRLAMVLSLNNKPDDALRELDTILQLDPRSASAWFAKGKVALQKQDLPLAIDAFQRSDELKADPDVEFALAKIYLQQKDKPKAEAVFQSMLNRYGDRAIWHMVFGGGYREYGFRQDAIREFKRAIELDPRLPHVHFFLALTDLENNSWGPTEQSFRELQEAVRVEPQDFYANHYLGAMESKQGKFAESDKHLKVAAQADPASPYPWLFLGSNAFQSKNYDLAKQYLTKAIALTGKDEGRDGYMIRKAYIMLGRISIAEGRKQEGQAQLEHSKKLFAEYMKVIETQVGKQAVEAGMGGADGVGGDLPGIVTPPRIEGTSSDNEDQPRPELTREQLEAIQSRRKQLRAILGYSFNDWGTAEARQKNYAVAAELFKEAETWNPDTPRLMRNLGMAAVRQEDYPEAARALRMALKADPQDMALRTMLGMALFNTNSFTEAAQVFSPLGDNALRDPRIAYAWALSLIKTNQYQPASGILQKLQAQQSSTDTLLLIAQAWSEMGYYPQAAAACQKAVQIDPQVQRAHFLAGNAWMRLEKYDDAVREFRAEMTVSPDDVGTEYSLAYALLRLSKTDEAVGHLKHVLAKAPDHPGANYQLGKVLLDGGQTKDAITYLESAARLSPDLDYVHYQLQMAYRKDGRREDADRELAVYKQIKAEKRESSVRRLEENSKKADDSGPN